MKLRMILKKGLYGDNLISLIKIPPEQQNKFDTTTVPHTYRRTYKFGKSNLREGHDTGLFWQGLSKIPPGELKKKHKTIPRWNSNQRRQKISLCCVVTQSIRTTTLQQPSENYLYMKAYASCGNT